MSERPALVVIPQLAGSADLVGPFTRELSDDLDVVVIEPPGFGSSPSPRGIPSTRALAGAAVAQWAERGVGRAHLFGISLGGMIAQWMAIDAPDRIDHLVLASTASRGARVVADGEVRALAMARCLLGSRAQTAECIVETILTDDSLEGARADEVMAAAVENARSTRDLAWLAAAAVGHDAEAELARVRAPTLVLSGEHDRIIPPATQALLAAAIPGARQAIVPACTHDLTLEQPERTAERVRAFLRA